MPASPGTKAPVYEVANNRMCDTHFLLHYLLSKRDKITKSSRSETEEGKRIGGMPSTATAKTTREREEHSLLRAISPLMLDVVLSVRVR